MNAKVRTSAGRGLCTLIAGLARDVADTLAVGRNSTSRIAPGLGEAGTCEAAQYARSGLLRPTALRAVNQNGGSTNLKIRVRRVELFARPDVGIGQKSRLAGLGDAVRMKPAMRRVELSGLAKGSTRPTIRVLFDSAFDSAPDHKHALVCVHISRAPRIL